MAAQSVTWHLAGMDVAGRLRQAHLSMYGGGYALRVPAGEVIKWDIREVARVIEALTEARELAHGR